MFEADDVLLSSSTRIIGIITCQRFFSADKIGALRPCPSAACAKMAAPYQARPSDMAGMAKMPSSAHPPKRERNRRNEFSAGISAGMEARRGDTALA